MLSRFGLRAAIGALAIALGLFASSVNAEGKKAVINAATTTYYLPFALRDPASNKLTGFNIDLVEAIAGKMGAKVNWTETSFDQLLPSILTGRADLIITIGDSPERRASVNMLVYLADAAVFFTLRENAANFPSAESLCGKRVAVARTTTWVGRIAKWSEENCTKAGKPGITMVPTESTPFARLDLKQGRADAAVQGQPALNYLSKSEGDAYFVISALPLTPLDYDAIGFSKNEPEFGQALKQALATLMADGTYRQLMQKWNVPEASAIPRPILNGQP